VNHLHDDVLSDLAAGRGSSTQREHAEACTDCAARVHAWRADLADLQEMETLGLDDRERHQLRALFRAHGPVRPALSEWLARLVRSTALAPAAVRGSAVLELQEHAAGPFHVTVRASVSSPGSAVEVHGQVLSDEGPVGGGELVVSDETGRVAAGEIDDLGEFSVAVPAGRYRAALVLSRGRIVIPQLDLGGAD